MNSKLAKNLRRLARGMAVKAELSDRQLIENETKRKYKFSPRFDESGNTVLDDQGKPLFNVEFISAGMSTNNEKTYRGIYRNMKREVLGKPVRQAI